MIRNNYQWVSLNTKRGNNTRRNGLPGWLWNQRWITQNVTLIEFWIINWNGGYLGGGGHSQWLTRLTCTLIGAFQASCGGLFSAVQPICEMEAEFCRRILPYVIQYLLTVGDIEVRKIISKHVSIRSISIDFYFISFFIWILVHSGRFIHGFL